MAEVIIAVFDSVDRLRLAVLRDVQMKAVGAVRKQQHRGSGPSLVYYAFPIRPTDQRHDSRRREAAGRR